jgi:hypothetical protein
MKRIFNCQKCSKVLNELEDQFCEDCRGYTITLKDKNVKFEPGKFYAAEVVKNASR